MAILTSKQTWRRHPKPKQLGNRLGHVERERARQAAIYLRGLYATRSAAAHALGMTIDALNKACSKRRAQTYRLACVLARVAGFLSRRS